MSQHNVGAAHNEHAANLSHPGTISHKEADAAKLNDQKTELEKEAEAKAGVPTQPDANTAEASDRSLRIVDAVLSELSQRGLLNLDNVQYDLLQTIKAKAALRVEEVV